MNKKQLNPSKKLEQWMSQTKTTETNTLYNSLTEVQLEQIVGGAVGLGAIGPGIGQGTALLSSSGGIK